MPYLSTEHSASGHLLIHGNLYYLIYILKCYYASSKNHLDYKHSHRVIQSKTLLKITKSTSITKIVFGVLSPMAKHPMVIVVVKVCCCCFSLICFVVFVLLLFLFFNLGLYTINLNFSSCLHKMLMLL